MTKQVVYRKIPVTERLPNKENENYLTFSEKGMATGRFFNGRRFESAYYEGEITHWLEEVQLPTHQEVIEMGQEKYLHPDDFGCFEEGANYILDKILKTK